MIRVPIKLRRVADESYDVRIGRGLGPRLTVALRKKPLGRRYVIVTDSHLTRHGESLMGPLVEFTAAGGHDVKRVCLPGDRRGRL